MTFRWTEKNIRNAVKMWRDDKSMAEIAEKIGSTRGSVAGMISRNRLMFERKGEEKEILHKVKYKLNQGRKEVEYIEPKLDEYEKARLPGVSLVDNDGCMYPLTESLPHMFCGCDRVELGRYCEYHAKKCSNGITGDSRWYKKLVKGVE